MTVQASYELLCRLNLCTNPQHLETLPSSVTTEWRVNWDEDMIARDLMQNFYDANRNRVDEIQVISKEKTVHVSGPEVFNLKSLFYIGSTKGEESVGRYGEGFKVAVACLLRNPGVALVARSGDAIVRVRVAESAVEGINVYPLEYDFFSSSERHEGTELIVVDCSKKMIGALRRRLHHFFYERNPLLGDKAWSSHNGEFLIYRSKDTNGHVFYRNLKRGEIPRIPVILVIRKEIKSIEREIAADRDRKAFGGKLMELFYRSFAGELKWERDGQRLIIEAGKAVWREGHPLLAEIAEKIRYDRRAFDEATVGQIFGDQYFARSASRDVAEQLRFNDFEREWEKAGKFALPGYFEQFGVLSANQHCKELDAKARAEARKADAHLPTVAEATSIQVLTSALRNLAPTVMAIFDKRATVYTVAKTDALLGQLRDARAYHSTEVFFSEDVFVADFPTAMAVFLHEHSHIFGYDSSRGFTDALTELVETVIRHRHDLDEYETSWLAAQKQVVAERRSREEAPKSPSLDKQLASMGEGELRKVLKHIPTAVVQRAVANVQRKA